MVVVLSKLNLGLGFEREEARPVGGLVHVTTGVGAHHCPPSRCSGQEFAIIVRLGDDVAGAIKECRALGIG